MVVPARSRSMWLRTLVWSGPDEVPQVAVEILEDGNRAIVCDGRFADELDPALDHVAIVAPEVIRPQEESDPAARLVAHERRLSWLRRAGEEQAGASRAGRSNDDPALVLRGLVRVLDKRKVQLAGEESDRLVVVAYNERDVCDRLFHCHVPPLVCEAGCASPTDTSWPGSRNISAAARAARCDTTRGAAGIRSLRRKTDRRPEIAVVIMQPARLPRVH